MRRLVAYVMIALVAMATVLPPGGARAQEPWNEPPPTKIATNDITPYMVGLGAIMGIIAFNIAAPTVSAWFASTVRSVSNIGSVMVATQRVATGAGSGAAAAASPAAAPVVPAVSEVLMARAQIMGTAAAAAGAAVVSYVYRLVHWATGAAP